MTRPMISAGENKWETSRRGRGVRKEEAEKNPHPPHPPVLSTDKVLSPSGKGGRGEHRENIADQLTTHNSHQEEVPFGTYVTVLRIGSERNKKRRSRSVGDIHVGGRDDAIGHDGDEGGGGGGGRSRSSGHGGRGGVIRGETPIRIRVRSQVEDLTDWQKRRLYGKFEEETKKLSENNNFKRSANRPLRRASSLSAYLSNYRSNNNNSNNSNSVKKPPRRKTSLLETRLRSLSTSDLGFGANWVEEEVALYRTPGQRLGIGLRFVGGGEGDPSRQVRSLLVQGCAPGSPAAGALCSWGRGLRSGDEVVQVAGQTVQHLTRAQCVRLLKEPSLIVRMRIRHFFAGSSSSSSTSSSSPPPHSSSYSPSSHHSSLNSYDFLKAEELFKQESPAVLSSFQPLHPDPVSSLPLSPPPKPERTLSLVTIDPKSPSSPAVAFSATKSDNRSPYLPPRTIPPKPIEERVNSRLGSRSNSVPALVLKGKRSEEQNERIKSNHPSPSTTPPRPSLPSKQRAPRAPVKSRAPQPEPSAVLLKHLPPALQGPARARIARRCSSAANGSRSGSAFSQVSLPPKRRASLFLKSKEPAITDKQEESSSADTKSINHPALPLDIETAKPYKELNSTCVNPVLVVQDKLASSEPTGLPPRAELYMNILDDDEQPQQHQQQQGKNPSKLSKSLSFRSVASDSTASTVQSAYVTPSVTPAASFNAADNLPKPRFNLDESLFGDKWKEDEAMIDDADFTFEDLLTSADQELINNNTAGSFDILSSLLDPFEQLEKEFESSNGSGKIEQLSAEIERQLPQLLDKSSKKNDDICDCEDVIYDDDCFFEERCQESCEVSLSLDKIRHDDATGPKSDRKATTMGKAEKKTSNVIPKSDETKKDSLNAKSRNKLNDVHERSSLPKGSNSIRSLSSSDILINSVIPPPPTHSRLPPDGHEFPQEFKDYSRINKQSAVKKAFLANEKAANEKKILSPSSPPPASSLTTRAKVISASSANSRQDERSSKSVRDKIAMFGGRSKSVDHMLLVTRSTGSLVDNNSNSSDNLRGRENSGNIWMRREKGLKDPSVEKRGERSRSMVEIARTGGTSESSVQGKSQYDRNNKDPQKPIIGKSNNHILPLSEKLSVGYNKKASRSMSFMIEERKRTFERLASQTDDKVELSAKCQNDQRRHSDSISSTPASSILPFKAPVFSSSSSTLNVVNNNSYDNNNSTNSISKFKQNLLEGGSMLDRYFPPPPPPAMATTKNKTFSNNSDWFDRKLVSSPESEVSIQELMVNFEDSSTEGSLYSVSTATSNSVSDIIVPAKARNRSHIPPPSDFKVGEQINNFHATDMSDSNSSSNNNGESTEWDSFDPAETKWDKRPIEKQIDQRFVRNSTKQKDFEVKSPAKAVRNVQKPYRSVHDLRSAFEVFDKGNNGHCQNKSASTTNLNSRRANVTKNSHHHRVPSVDSTTSDESALFSPTLSNSMSCLLSPPPSSSASSGPLTNLKDRYGSVSSLASSTSLISPQELQGLINDANQSLEESGTPSHEIMVVVLHREFMSGSIGITLAGGADYENKEITVHKVIPGTLADRDGRIQKGDRVLSINGRSTKGVTHREALSILKAPRSEVVLVLSRNRSVTPASTDTNSSLETFASAYPFVNVGNGMRPPRILESPYDAKALLAGAKYVDCPRGPPVTAVLKKEGTGLGFSLEGGRDSPLGDRPITIKKIFAGGAADKTKSLVVGDQIVSVNGVDFSTMSRIEAWNFMKKLGDGQAIVVVRHKMTHNKTPHQL